MKRKVVPPGFVITRGKGLHMRFANGNTVSFQWGSGNYCDNRNLDINTGHERLHHHADVVDRLAGSVGCDTAEVAAWNANEDWYRLGASDTVIGYQKPDQILNWLVLFALHENPSQEMIDDLREEND